jgi:hypothetical protein
MSKEFRLSTTVTLPEDEFEQAATLIQCGKLKAAVMKLTEEHKLVAVVSHETVTPRERKAAAVPEVAAELAPEAASKMPDLSEPNTESAPEPTPLHVRRGQHNAPSAA